MQNASKKPVLRLAAILAMVFALLWPSLSPAFASASMSAEQLLARDIALSLCSESNGSGAPANTGHDGKPCDLCVLCRALASAALPEAGNGQATLPPARPAIDFVAADWRVPAIHPLDWATGPPRAPPFTS
jgi:hypothetical protein